VAAVNWGTGRAIGRGPISGAASAPSDGRVGSAPVPVSPDAPEDVEALIAELREAARHAGVQRDDPMMPLLTALAHQIRFLAKRNAQSERIATETSERILSALHRSHQVADAEIDRFKAGIAATETITIQRIADSIAKTADRALTRRVAVFQWQLVLGAAGILVLIAAGCLGGGYWWGRDNTLASVHETETGLQTAFAESPAAAQKWLDLMRWNPIIDALGQCTGAAVSTQDGRKACNVPLWIEPPHPGPSPQQ
jgi:hypothetical protein